MTKTHILIAEDDSNLRQGLCDLLEAEGCRVTAVADGAAALSAWQQERPDLALLDVMMPEKSGFDVCRAIRRTDALLPIILLTAKGEEIDKVIGLELGADDYITKPFGLHELRARIAAVLRRAQAANGAENNCRDNADCFAIGSAQINRKTYEVELDGKVQSLSGRELTLLDYFVQRRGEVISRNDLLNAAWGVDYYGTTRTLDQHIAQLRKKIEPDPAAPQYLLTVHGIGYKLVPPGG